MPLSNYPNGFANGVTIRGLPINLAFPGKVKFLNNSSVLAPGGIAGNDGGYNDGSYQKPFKTLSYAVNTGTALNSGDIVMVMPGHAETISSATALTLSNSGIAVLGLGSGSLRPTFTLDTGTTSTINISGSNLAFCNCLFVANFAAIASCFTLTTGAGFTLSNCEFRDTSSILNFAALVTTDTTSHDADGLYIDSCQFYGLGSTSNTCAVSMLGTNDRVSIVNSYFAHKATTEAGLMPIATGKVVTNATISNNVCNFVGTSGDSTGTLITTNGSTNSGMISKNLIQSSESTTPILVTASSGFRFSQNYYAHTADKSGYLIPPGDSG